MLLAATAATAAGGAALAVVAPASAGKHDHAATLCAAPWQWNGPLSLLHAGHASGYAACGGGHGRGSDISVLDDACAVPWGWDGPLEIVTVDLSRSHFACDRDPAG
ncbi:hypothetical protein [Lentzea fradiae]|nr:hypothetical protein [Lentzea fradiae]